MPPVGAARAAPTLADEHRGPVVTLHQLARDDADDAGVPARVAEDDGVREPLRGRPRVHRLLGVLVDLGLDPLTAPVRIVEGVGEGARRMEVRGED